MNGDPFALYIERRNILTETQARIDKMLKKSEVILNAGKPKHNDIKVPPFTDGQKKLIEMTEKLANGKLICDVDDDIDVLTNEEWFTRLSTEEKATFLAIQVRLGVEFYRTDDERYQNYDWWIKWLKEKYK